MKKFDLLKILGIAFAITILLSWVIPAGLYSSGVFTSSSTVTVGLYDIFRIPAITIATFIQYGVVFLAIGAFYGVLNKVGLFAKVVDIMTEKWKGNKLFLFMTIAFFALLSSLTALPTVIFILVPLFVAVLLNLGYNKLTSFAATVGAMLIGQIGSVLGFNLWGYLAVFLEFKMVDLILVRVVLFLVTTALFMIVVCKKSQTSVTPVLRCSKCDAKLNKTAKFCNKCGTKVKAVKETTKEIAEEVKNVDIPFMEKHTTKKSTVPFVIITVLMIVVAILGLYNWYYAFNISTFNSLNETITSFKIGEYPIFANLLGSVSEFGFWGNYDLTVVILIAALLMGWIYSLKFTDILDGIKNGMKKMLPVAFYAMIASVLFTVVLNMSSGNFVLTMVDKVLSITDGFNFLTTTLGTIIASFYYNDFYTLVNTLYGTFALYDANVLTTVSFIVEAIYGLVMVIAPTSIFLLAGLRYMEIPYKDWAKYIWKFVLIMLAVIILMSFLLTVLI